MSFRKYCQISAGLALAAILASCGEAPAPESALPIDYRAVSLADIDTAEKLAQRCQSDEARFREHLAILEAFAGTPTVDGYYASLDSLYTSISTIQAHASSLSGVHPDEELRSAGEDCELLLTRLNTEMSLSRPLFDAVGQINVSDVDDATRERIREINDEIAAIGQEFDRNIREDVRYLELDSVEDLAGLPEDYIAAHQPDEDGKIIISTQYPDVFPFFEYAENDALRKEMSLIYSNRAYPQNEEVLRNLVVARHELAQLAGFNNYAELVTVDKMSGSPERVADFLEDLKGYTAETQDAEYEILLARLREENPGAERLESWQNSYIRSKVRRE